MDATRLRPLPKICDQPVKHGAHVWVGLASRRIREIRQVSWEDSMLVGPPLPCREPREDEHGT